MGLHLRKIVQVRNSKVYDLYNLLIKNNSVDIYDPLAD